MQRVIRIIVILEPTNSINVFMKSAGTRFFSCCFYDINHVIPYLLSSTYPLGLTYMATIEKCSRP